ncbi:uncharacterized protein [Nothobranchius furzeri]|uniref:Transcript variant X4 n=1 Tax=Nothobranchius furzeri TaxID=105023 RepID=A0A9D3BKF8_NOTFU|nr:transcript variant X4 [Nothobranchius furzeri]
MSDRVQNATTRASLRKRVTFNMNSNKVYIAGSHVPSTPETSADAEGVIKVTDDQRKTHVDVSEPNTSCKNVSCSVFRNVSLFCTPTCATSSSPTKHVCTSGSALSAPKSAPVHLQKSDAASKEWKSAVGSTAESEVCNKTAPCSKMEKLLDVRQTSVASANTAEPPVTHPHPGVTSSLPAPYLNIIPVGTKAPQKGRCCKPAGQTAQSGNLPAIGLSQLVIVLCEEKRQVFCRLCSVKLSSSSHSRSFDHCFNYVKMKYPGWTASQVEKELSSVVAPLAELERRLKYLHPQKIEVNRGVYWFLASLPEDKAVETVKTLLRQTRPRVSSSTGDTAETLGLEVSSSDDGVRVFDREVSDVCDKQIQTDLIQITEMLKEDDRPGDLQRSDDPIQEPRSCVSSDQVNPDPVPGVQDEEMIETVQQDSFDPDAEVKDDVTDVSGTPQEAETLVGPGRWRPPAAETQQWKRDVRQLDEELLTRPQKVPRFQTCGLQPQTCAEAGQQSPSGPSYRAEVAPEQGAEPRGQRASQEGPRALLGGKAPSCSHLSFYLTAGGCGSRPVVGERLCKHTTTRSTQARLHGVCSSGMASVWECRGLSQDTFFLCESCEDILSHRDICLHLVSRDHQLNYLWRERPEVLETFWPREDLPSELRKEILNRVVWEFAVWERDRVDTPCVLLEQELHQFVRTAHYIEGTGFSFRVYEGNGLICVKCAFLALNILRFITNEETSVRLSNRTTHQKSTASAWECRGLSQEDSNLQ